MHALYRELVELRRRDGVLSAPSHRADLHATAYGSVLQVVRRRGSEERRLLVTFGTAGQAVDVPAGWRVVFVSGVFRGQSLGGRSAVILANP